MSAAGWQLQSAADGEMGEGVAEMRRGWQRHGISGYQRRPETTRRWRLAALTGGLLALGMTVASCGSTGTEGACKPTAGGTATYALPPNTTPNYIFPLSPGAYFSVVNSSNLQLLMYRPLYWFGTSNGLPYLNEQLSLAERPVYGKHSVTITLKKYRWSDGETVSAKDVVFWMNMLTAVSRVSSSSINWGGYVPHEFPSNVLSATAISPYKVRLVIKGSFS